MANRNNQGFGKLAYRLPQTVTCHAINGRFQLVLNFPLKSIFLHPSWRVVFENLSTGSFVPLKNIVSLVNGVDADKIELFLNDLVRKGFLEQQGLPLLGDYPFVSIIIPVRNRPAEIEDCLQSLGQLIYPPKKLEIIVVDDASTDNTSQRILKFPVFIISLKENKKAPYCRNLAAKQAKGDILAFIDSDCMADSLWLQELVPAFKDSSLAAVGGIVDAHFEKSLLDWYEKVKSSLVMGFRVRRSSESERFLYVPSCNLMVRRDPFLKLGGFREELVVGEDVDFCWRLQDAGHRVEFRPSGKVYHKHRNKLRGFCSRRFDYGTSEPLLQQLHPERRKQIFFPPAESLFWGVAVLAIILKSLPLLALCGIMVVTDALRKHDMVTRRGIPIRLPQLLLAVIRSYFAFFYHQCAFVSRYYLIWSVLCIPLLPLASTTIVGMHLLTGLVEYLIKKPCMNPVSFIFYFSLEQLSYQSGVWWGCIRNSSFSAVNPRVVCVTPEEGSS